MCHTQGLLTVTIPRHQSRFAFVSEMRAEVKETQLVNWSQFGNTTKNMQEQKPYSNSQHLHTKVLTHWDPGTDSHHSQVSPPL